MSLQNNFFVKENTNEEKYEKYRRLFERSKL